MKLAALLVGAVLLLGGCTSGDDKPSPEPSTTSTSATPSADDIAAVDRRVEAAIKSGDTSALRAALREAGTLAGRQAAAEDDQQAVRVDARAHRDYRVATWWSAEYSDDSTFTRLFPEGTLLPYADVARDPALLEDLQTLGYRVENDWKDDTGERLRFTDDYDAAFDKELPDQ